MNASKRDVVNPYLRCKNPLSSTPAVVPILTPQVKSTTSSSSSSSQRENDSLAQTNAEISVPPLEATAAVVSETKPKKSGNNHNMSKRQQLISELRTLKKQQQMQLQQLELYKLQKKQRKMLKKQQKQQQQQQTTTANQDEQQTQTPVQASTNNSPTTTANEPSLLTPTEDFINRPDITHNTSISQDHQRKEDDSNVIDDAKLDLPPSGTDEGEKVSKPTNELPVNSSALPKQELPRVLNETQPVFQPSESSVLLQSNQQNDLSESILAPAVHNTTSSNAAQFENFTSQIADNQATLNFQRETMTNVMTHSSPWFQQYQHHLPLQYPWQYFPMSLGNHGTYVNPWNCNSHIYLQNHYPPTASFPPMDNQLTHLVPSQYQHPHNSAAIASHPPYQMAMSQWTQAPQNQVKRNPLPIHSAQSRGNVSKHADTKKKLAATRLASSPCEAPSPFAKTHDILNDIFYVQRPDEANSSFGIILKLDMRSVLLGNTEATNNEKADTVIPPKPQRRKRFFFSVLMVSDPSVQNQRRTTATSTVEKGTVKSENLLQPDDIILEINGTSTANLTFHEACSLFKTCTTSTQLEGTDQNMITCSVRIARKRPLPPKQPSLAISVLQQPRPLPPKSPLDKDEAHELALGAFWANWDPRRLLGHPASSGLLGKIIFHSLPSSVLLGNRGETFDVEAAWNGSRNQIESQMKRSAAAYWNDQWRNIPEPHWTDAKSAVLRAKPRPSSAGCRCGSKDHRYVNDPNCALYRNLLSIASEGGDESKENELMFSEQEVFTERKRALNEVEKDLNVVQKAFTDRIIRIQTESEAELAEAKFVNRMEEIQLKNLQQAVTAPKSLTAMVLSAVLELKAEFDDRKNLGAPLQQPTRPTVLVENGNVASEKIAASDKDPCNIDSDDDDDVPLATLGKRMNAQNDSQPDSAYHSDKRRKGNPSIAVNPMYLARMIQYLSYRWGHVYKEPSNEEYLWRWEVYHGQAEESDDIMNNWNDVRRSCNPRKPGFRSLENLRFLVNDSFLCELEQLSTGNDGGKNNSSYSVDALKVLAHILSSSRTGICDELLALLRAEAICIDDRGVFVPSKDWWAKVDFLLLEDMDEKWSKASDAIGKSGISMYMQTILSKKWCRTDYGWALTSESDDIVFEFAEFDEWRAAFEEKQSARLDGAVGVGKFR